MRTAYRVSGADPEKQGLKLFIATPWGVGSGKVSGADPEKQGLKHRDVHRLNEEEDRSQEPIQKNKD